MTLQRKDKKKKAKKEAMTTLKFFCIHHVMSLSILQKDWFVLDTLKNSGNMGDLWSEYVMSFKYSILLPCTLAFQKHQISFLVEYKSMLAKTLGIVL